MGRTTRGGWYLTRRSEIEALLRDVASFGADMTSGTGLQGVEQLFLPEIAEPVHGQVRRLYNACFGPHRVSDVRPIVRELCEQRLDRAIEEDIVDLHEGYALPIRSTVMAHVIGRPEDVGEKFPRWSLDGSVMLRPECPGSEPGGPPIDAYLREELERQRTGDAEASHTFRTFLAAEVEGAPLSDTQIVAQLHTMVLGGVHTTRGLLAHTTQRLIFDRALFERLRDDRDLIPVFVEESLRHDPPAPAVTRRYLRDAELGGVEMHQADWINVSLASGNRDEAVCGDDPAAFRLDRPDPQDHVAFGAGRHVCPGAGLARLEAVTVIETLLDRVAELRPVEGHPYSPMPGHLAMGSLPAYLTPRARVG